MTQALQTTTGIQAAVRRAGTQAGISLLELIAALTVIAAIIVGALALYTAASSSQGSTQLVQDLVAIRSAVREIHQGQGNYAGSQTAMFQVLNNAKRIPSTIRVDTGTNLMYHQFANGATQGEVRVTGATATFTIALTQVPRDVCIKLLSTSSGWVQVVVGSTTISSFPVPAATANTTCANNFQTLTYTSN